MFGFFKKKKSALDVLVEAVYGANPPKKSANLNESINLAYEKLLSEQIPLDKVSQLAKQLNASEIPYNTYDLALCTALNFFKDSENKTKLFSTQLMARVYLLQWIAENKCSPNIAKIFETTLYNSFKDYEQGLNEDVEPLNKDIQTKFKAQSLIGVIERKSFTKQGYFFDIHQDFEAYYFDNKQVSADILMPALYARRFCFAGMYAQGLTTKNNFDEIDQSFFQSMAQIGQLISKQEQIEFQEESFDKAMKWINHYYYKVEILTAKLLIVSAKNGLSLRDALKAAVDAWETDSFSENLDLKNLSPEFCTLFYTVGGWLPNDQDDEYHELMEKSYNFLLDPFLHPYRFLSKYKP